jgi:hypothetical protein
MAESGHHPGRSFLSRDGEFHLNGAAFFNDGGDDISAALELLDDVTTELSILDGVTASTDAINETAALPTANSTIALSAGGSATQTATITLKDADDAALAAVRRVEVYMADGDTPSSAGANSGVTATTGAIVTAHTTDLHFTSVTDDNGVLVLEFDNTSGGGAYTDRVILVLPTGAVVVSAALNTATS